MNFDIEKFTLIQNFRMAKKPLLVTWNASFVGTCLQDWIGPSKEFIFMKSTHWNRGKFLALF